MAARKKRRKKKSRPGPAREQEASWSNRPFAGLKQALEQKPPPAGEADAPSPAEKPAPPEPDEEALFARAMADVEPLEPRQRDRRPRLGECRQPRLEMAVDEDLEVLAQLAELVAGGGEFDIRFSDQYVEGAGEGVGPELRRRLGRGHFPIQDYLDLHGLGQEQALAEVERFLTASVTRGLRHVLIVHGRGTGSPGGVPVLKRALTRALGHKRLRRRVLAFCTAQPGDGGEGAMYVLLRKWSGPGPVTG